MLIHCERNMVIITASFQFLELAVDDCPAPYNNWERRGCSTYYLRRCITRPRNLAYICFAS